MSANYLPPLLPDAITPTMAQTAKVAYPAEFVIEHILKLSIYIIGLSNVSALFRRVSSKPYTPSLYTLLDRLQSKQLGPSRLPWGFQNAEHMKSRVHLRADKEPAFRPLADFEDVYYALLARMQEMSQLMHLRIRSGFNDASSLVCKGGPTISELHASLTEYWNIFNDPRCAKALDDAVREARVQAMRDEIISQVDEDNMTVEEAHEQLSELYSPDVYNGVLGMHFVRDWAPAIVGMYLEQKYRPMFDVEKQDERAQEKRRHRRAMRQADRDTVIEQQIQHVAEQPEPRNEPIFDTDIQVRIHGALGQYDPSDAGRTTSILEGLRSLSLADQAQKRYGIQPNYQTYVQQRHHECQAQTYNHEHHEEQTAASCAHHNREYDETYESTLDAMLQWQVRAQRVSEYSRYLRSRASQDIQQIIHGVQGLYIPSTQPVDGFTGDSTVGEGFMHLEMDMTDHFRF